MAKVVASWLLPRLRRGSGKADHTNMTNTTPRTYLDPQQQQAL
jgi:hypothetical protein